MQRDSTTLYCTCLPLFRDRWKRRLHLEKERHPFVFLLTSKYADFYLISNKMTRKIKSNKKKRGIKSQDGTMCYITMEDVYNLSYAKIMTPIAKSKQTTMCDIYFEQSASALCLLWKKLTRWTD